MDGDEFAALWCGGGGGSLCLPDLWGGGGPVGGPPVGKMSPLAVVERVLLFAALGLYS
jgi:hypothetical protein